MKKSIVFLGLFAVLNANIFSKNYIVCSLNDTVGNIIKKINGLKQEKYILINKNADFNPHCDGYKIYDIDTLNNILKKKHSKSYVSIIEKNKNTVKLKIVPFEAYNAYNVKGVRLDKKYHINEVIDKLNKEHYQQVSYFGDNFIIPENNNVVIKNIKELENYLNAFSDKKIVFDRAVDIDNDGIIDVIKYKQKSYQPQKHSIKELIKKLQTVKKEAKKVKDKMFDKETFIESIDEMINELKPLEK